MVKPNDRNNEVDKNWYKNLHLVCFHLINVQFHHFYTNY